MEKKNNYLINITIALCSIYYFWMLIRIIILKNGFIDMGYNSNLVLFDFINQYHQSGLTKVLLVNIIGNAFRSLVSGCFNRNDLIFVTVND